MDILELIHNLLALVAIGVFSGFIETKWKRETLTGQTLQGLTFGLIAIVGMMMPYEVEKGLFFDGRTIVISLCTLFFGPIAGGISAIIPLAYRISIAGVGLLMGISTIVSAFLIGWIFNAILRKRGFEWLTIWRLYIFGLIVHLVMFLLLFTLPPKYLTNLLSTVGLAIVIVYPLISVILGKVLSDQKVASAFLSELRKREYLFRTTLYSIGDAVITTNKDGLIQNMNNVAENLTGWKEAEAKNLPIEKVFQIVNEFSLEKVVNPVERVIREGVVVGLANHTLLITRDGREIPIADSGAPIKDERGNIIGVVLVFRDQTEERKARKIIEEAEKRYRQFVYSTTDGVWRFDLRKPVPTTLDESEQIKLMFENAYLAECNDAYAKMYGYDSASEFIGIRLKDVMDPDDPANIEYLKNFIRNGYRLTGGISIEKDRYGNIVYIENNLVGIIEDGNLIRGWGTQKNITEKYLLERQLIESEEKFRLLAESSLVGIYIKHNEKFVYVNKTLADIFGYSVEEIEGKLGPLDLALPEYHSQIIEFINKRLSGEIEFAKYSYKARRKDGNIIHVEVMGKRALFKDKVVIIGTLVDITEKIRLEEENRIKTQQLESTLENTPNVAIQWYNEKGEVIYWNKASENLFGWSKEEAIGKKLDEIMLGPEEFQLWMNVLNSLKNGSNFYGPFENKFVKKSGEEGWALSTSFVIETLIGEKIFVCMDIDITDRKKYEEELAEREELFRTLTNTTPVAMLIYQLENIIFANPAIERITGYSIEELYKIKALELVHPDQRDLVRERLMARFRGEQVPNRYEIKILCKGGATKWVDFSTGLFHWKGKLSAIGSAIDITERKINEEIVKIQRNIADCVVQAKSLGELFEKIRTELSQLLDTTNFFIAFYDEGNDELYSFFEWDEKKDAPARWSAKNSITGKVVKEKKTYLFKRDEIEKLIESGEIIKIGHLAESWLGAPIVVDEKPVGAIVIQSYDNPNAYDEQSLKLIELIANQLSSYISKITQSETLRKLWLAVELSQAGIAITDIDATYEYVNPKYCEITGYSRNELIGNKASILKSGYHKAEFYAKLWETLKSGKEWQGEFLNKRKDGELFWLKAQISPIFDEKGEITHFVNVCEDVTTQKQIIEELVATKEKALESERLKTAFLANMSHEVRTPLNGILGFAQILQEQTLPVEEVKNFAKIIVKRGYDLLELFNEILDISQIETGKLPISPKQTNINNILYDIFTTFSVSEELRYKPIEFRIGKTLPEDFSIVTDPLRLKQILSNLIHNAIKFTKQGLIEFGASLQEKDKVLFYVKDTGIGIPKNNLDTIFETFRKVETNFLTSQYQGPGLGLSISKGLVKLLNGEIWVESTFGVGSTFYFTIAPLSEKPEPKVETVEKVPPKLITRRKFVVLVAEDDYVNYLVIERILKKEFNCEVLFAKDGQEAIEYAKNRPEIDFAIIDIRMPNVDGFTAFTKIKELNPNIKIIAITAYAFPEDQRKILDYGFDAYLAKPFNYEDLIKLVNKVIIERIN